MDVPESYVVELGEADVAQEDDVVVSYHHAALGADRGLGYGNVGGEDGGDGRVESLGFIEQKPCKEVLELLVELVEGEVLHGVTGEQDGASGPR